MPKTQKTQNTVKTKIPNTSPAGQGILVVGDKMHVNMSAFDTDSLAEGKSNFYFTPERVQTEIDSYLTKDRVNDFMTGALSPGTGIDIDQSGRIQIVQNEIRDLFSGTSGIVYDHNSGTFGLVHPDVLTAVISGEGLQGIHSDNITTLSVGAGPGIIVNQHNVSIDPNFAGPGLVCNHDILFVGAGEGIVVNEHNVSLSHAIAGNGLEFENGSISIVPGRGIRVSHDHIDADMSDFDTGSFVEGANLWFTYDRVYDAINKHLSPCNGIEINNGNIGIDYNYISAMLTVVNYEADNMFDEGTVVVFGGEKEITTTEKIYHHAVAGIVQSASHHIITEHNILLSIKKKGITNVNVNGIVNKGDLLVTSMHHGYAMSADLSKNILPTACIGIAMSENKKEFGKVKTQLI